jgi:hypothetical protein
MTEQSKKFLTYVAIAAFGILVLAMPTAIAMLDRHARTMIVQAGDDSGPLHGENPIFTIVPMTACKNAIGPFCDEWGWCGNRLCTSTATINGVLVMTMNTATLVFLMLDLQCDSRYEATCRPLLTRDSLAEEADSLAWTSAVAARRHWDNLESVQRATILACEGRAVAVDGS